MNVSLSAADGCRSRRRRRRPVTLVPSLNRYAVGRVYLRVCCPSAMAVCRRPGDVRTNTFQRTSREARCFGTFCGHGSTTRLTRAVSSPLVLANRNLALRTGTGDSIEPRNVSRTAVIVRCPIRLSPVRCSELRTGRPPLFERGAFRGRPDKLT